MQLIDISIYHLCPFWLKICKLQNFRRTQSCIKAQDEPTPHFVTLFCNAPGKQISKRETVSRRPCLQLATLTISVSGNMIYNGCFHCCFEQPKPKCTIYLQLDDPGSVCFHRKKGPTAFLVQQTFLSVALPFCCSLRTLIFKLQS